MIPQYYFKLISPVFGMAILFGFSGSIFAGGNMIDKIYHPYVYNREAEIEYRLLAEDVLDKLLSPA